MKKLTVLIFVAANLSFSLDSLGSAEIRVQKEGGEIKYFDPKSTKAFEVGKLKCAVRYDKEKIGSNKEYELENTNLICSGTLADEMFSFVRGCLSGIKKSDEFVDTFNLAQKSTQFLYNDKKEVKLMTISVECR